MGGGCGSLDFPGMIETTITLSLPWEAWWTEASIFGVTVAGAAVWAEGVDRRYAW